MNEKKISAIVLAGGYSSRMGKNKAELTLNGERLVDIQINKMRSLGIEDIMLSGYAEEIPGTRLIPDVFPHRGPVSGLHACLKEAKNPACIVLSVDVPLVPADALRQLISSHDNGATMLIHEGKYEPLMAVYDSALYKTAEELLQGEKASVMKLAYSSGFKTLEYTGDSALLSNCNTPEDFERVKQISGSYRPDSDI